MHSIDYDAAWLPCSPVQLTVQSLLSTNGIKFRSRSDLMNLLSAHHQRVDLSYPLIKVIDSICAEDRSVNRDYRVEGFLDFCTVKVPPSN